MVPAPQQRMDQGEQLEQQQVVHQTIATLLPQHPAQEQGKIAEVHLPIDIARFHGISPVIGGTIALLQGL